MKRLSILVLLSLLSTLSPLAAVEILTVDEIVPGSTGIGHTVWEGADIEPFEVEILGILRHSSPGRHLILAEAKDDRIKDTGVPGGISGSPVYIDGKLIGACAYTWSFAKRPVMAITPIEYMLDLMMREELPLGGSAGDAKREPTARRLSLPPFDPSAIHALAEGAEPVFLEPVRQQLKPALAEGLVPIPIGVSVSGLSSAGLAPLQEALGSYGLVPMTAGSMQGRVHPEADTSLKPGSSVGAALVRGDLRLDAFGTVTHVAGEHVLAFGHPYFGIGTVEFPMSEGWVHTVLPRRSSSFKIVSHVLDVGSIRQDREPGLYGIVGREPSMLPIHLELERGDGAVEKHFIEVIRDPVLTPLLAYVSLQALFSSAEKGSGAATIEFLEESSLHIEGHGGLDLQNFYSGSSAAAEAAGAIASYVAWILNNEFESPGIEALNLRLRYQEELRSAAIRSVTFGRSEASPGETVEVRLGLQPYQGPIVYEVLEFPLPEDISAGTWSLAVGSASALDKLTSLPGGSAIADFEDLLELIHGMRRNATVYVQLFREGESLLLEGEILDELPPSVQAMLRSERVKGRSSVFNQTGIVEEEFPISYRVSGMQRSTLKIRED